ncbi:MAG: prephenate dehydrogenase [Chitinophagales bacterium]|nr:prephenate dehydrogenase [Bacteroidota bacterium]MCB9042522.1 prephenate dehydrogenase [Chitinophagales bacterium]
MKTIAVIGLGLIGGSLALSCRKNNFVQKVLGIDESATHAEQALALHLVDEITDLTTACTQANLLVLAIPVDAMVKILPKILDLATPNLVITDVGSTKQAVLESIAHHPKRNQFVAAHPMAGTEFSGPSAAFDTLFQNKACIICNAADSNPEAVAQVEALFRNIGMHLIYMNAAEHDIHAAYISHISHISSFVLALTVLQKEKSDEAIFEMASGGFESTVRLAKSSAAMWTPIFLQNKNNILAVLDTYRHFLQQFYDAIAKTDAEKLNTLMQEANAIKPVLKRKFER